MKLKDILLDELERESCYARKALESVPDGRSDWKPHETSMTLGYLASMVAGMPAWIDLVVHQDELDIAPKDGPRNKPPEMRTSRELVAGLEAATAKGREALKDTTDDFLTTTSWKLLAGGRLLQERPRYLAILEGVFNHLAHHRGQLMVYLRMLGAKVPSIYGPSGDEKVA